MASIQQHEMVGLAAAAAVDERTSTVITRAAAAAAANVAAAAAVATKIVPENMVMANEKEETLTDVSSFDTVPSSLLPPSEETTTNIDDIFSDIIIDDNDDTATVGGGVDAVATTIVVTSLVDAIPQEKVEVIGSTVKMENNHTNIDADATATTTTTTASLGGGLLINDPVTNIQQNTNKKRPHNKESYNVTGSKKRRTHDYVMGLCEIIHKHLLKSPSAPRLEQLWDFETMDPRRVYGRLKCPTPIPAYIRDSQFAIERYFNQESLSPEQYSNVVALLKSNNIWCATENCDYIYAVPILEHSLYTVGVIIRGSNYYTTTLTNKELSSGREEEGGEGRDVSGLIIDNDILVDDDDDDCNMINISSCNVLVSRDNHIPGTNGCGALGIIWSESFLPHKDFYVCCVHHDHCYDTCNTIKDVCDESFITCLQNICTSDNTFKYSYEKYACNYIAQILKSAVNIFGCIFYKNAQFNACTCIEK